MTLDAASKSNLTGFENLWGLVNFNFIFYID